MWCIKKIKLTVLLPQSDVDELEYLAALDNITVTEALRRSVKTAALIRREVSNGSQFLLKRKGERQVRELIVI